MSAASFGTLEQILQPTNDLAWILEFEGYDQLRQSSLDSRFAISNGFLGVKGGRVTTRGARSIPPSRILCRRAVRHGRNRPCGARACSSRGLAAGPHLAGWRTNCASPR